jgi:hypothetical protein
VETGIQVRKTPTTDLPPMTLKAHVRYFVRQHLFSPRIFANNLFNLVFWVLVIAGIDIGAEGGIVSAFIGGVAGVVGGILFLASCYALYALTHRTSSKPNQALHQMLTPRHAHHHRRSPTRKVGSESTERSPHFSGFGSSTSNTINSTGRFAGVSSSPS